MWPGATCKLQGLQKAPSLNGKHVRVVRWDKTNEKMVIRIIDGDGKDKALKVDSLVSLEKPRPQPAKKPAQKKRSRPSKEGEDARGCIECKRWYVGRPEFLQLCGDKHGDLWYCASCINKWKIKEHASKVKEEEKSRLEPKTCAECKYNGVNEEGVEAGQGQWYCRSCWDRWKEEEELKKERQRATKHVNAAVEEELQRENHKQVNGVPLAPSPCRATVGPQQCESCNQIFKGKVAVRKLGNWGPKEMQRNDTQMARREEVWRCKHCWESLKKGYQIVRQQSLRTEEKKSSSSTLAQNCDKCGKTFKGKIALQKLGSWLTENRWKCRKCGSAD
eukprot:gnl/MRDRNA2_/MRDRNA2_80281_c0_seq2.p1 gnl/MRDRNA2_/MRDRNA2_80281_c0~~gnl/MRDRNA2_/MRDRNA2_80281_c0_seq2.p1  ORF type:complete len:333 (+),score=79.39 gnl/MRDRNA2_/MRDRNA2_80281_c0_seq2:228-1226(+)